MTTERLPGISVAPEWLIANLGPRGELPTDVVLADVRWLTEGSVGDAFAAGHLPGAISIDVESDLSAPAFDGPGRHPLPAPEAFARAMAASGIGDETAVIAYDDVGGMVAARLWWMLHVTGHESALLDLPSLAAWIEAGGSLETDGGRTEGSTARFTSRAWPVGLIADAAEVRSAVTERTASVIDVRAGERYRGEVEPIDPVAGHIPGAINAEWTANRDPVSGGMLSPTALHDRYARLGIEAGEAVIVSCGSGLTAAFGIFSMELAGMPGARLYEGSWSDWTHDPARPIATGPEPGRMPDQIV